jgi:peptidoglycan/LPS O-acetylase OafA/YrhL
MAAVAADPLVVDSATSGAVRAEAGNIAAIDGLRGLSVAWILLFHFVALRPSDPWAGALRDAPLLGAAIARGPWAVQLFFLISGFLLTLPWLARARDGRPAPSTRAFYLRRIRRIVPAYYLQLALLFAVVMPLLFGADYWRHDLYVYAANALAHAAFMHNLSPLTSASLNVNGALWTLAVEAQFYLLLPLLAPVFVRTPWRFVIATAMINTFWLLGAWHGFDAVVRWHLEAGARWGWHEEAIRGLLAIQLPAYAFTFALGALLARLWLRHRTWLDHPAVQSVLARGPLAFMGRISYSAYLWHLPLLLVLQARTNVSPAAFFPLYVATVAAVGWTSWRFVERPFMRPSAPSRESPPRAP